MLEQLTDLGMLDLALHYTQTNTGISLGTNSTPLQVMTWGRWKFRISRSKTLLANPLSSNSSNFLQNALTMIFCHCNRVKNL